MVEETPVDLFGNALVEAAVSCFHVENRNVPPLGRDRCKTAIGIAKNEKGVRLLPCKNVVRGEDHLRYGLRGSFARRSEIILRLTKLQLVEKNLAEFKIMVLASVNQHMVGSLIQLGHDPGQANDLGPRAHNRHDFEARRGQSAIGWVSGRSGSNCSFAHVSTTSSSSPMLVTSCAQPGIVSIISG